MTEAEVLAEITKASYNARTQLVNLPEAELVHLLPQIFSSCGLAIQAGLPGGNVRLIGDLVDYLRAKISIDDMVHHLNLHDEGKVVDAPLGKRNLTPTGE